MADVDKPKSRHQPRTQRVIEGWISDRNYQDRFGDTRALRISGAGNTFESLAKKFAGDVPHIAVLEELIRMRAVRVDSSHVRLQGPTSNAFSSLVKSINTVLPVVRDGVSAVTTHADSNSSPPVFRLTLKAADSRDVAVVRERVVAGASVFLHGLDRSLRRPRRPARAGYDHRVTISVLVSEQTSTKGTRCGKRSKEA
jgi:hypothetical protein